MSYPDWDTPLSKQDVSPRELRLAQNEIDALPAGALSGGANKGPVASNPVSGPLVDFIQGAAPANPAAGVSRLYARSNGRIYRRTSAGIEVPFDGQVANAEDYGAADASVVADSTALIDAAMTDLFNSGVGAGAILMPPMPAGYVLKRRVGGDQTNGGIRLRKGISLIGYKTKLLLRDNCSLITTRNPSNTAMTVATITGDIAYGDTSVVVNSSAGFAIGNNVYLRVANSGMGETAEMRWFAFAKVLTVPDGTHLGLDRPILQAMTVAGTTANARTVTLLDELIEDSYIGGFELINDMANGGNAEAGVDLSFCRNMRLGDLIADDPGAGMVTTQFCENLIGSNLEVRSSVAQNGQASKGRAFSFAETVGLEFDNVRIEKFEKTMIFAEFFSRAIRFTNVRVNNNFVGRDQTKALFATQTSEMRVDGVVVEGNGSIWQDDGGVSATYPGQDYDPVLSFSDVTIRTIDASNGLPPLWAFSGSLRLRGGFPAAILGDYRDIKRISLTFPLLPNLGGGYSLPLPSGLYRRIKVYVTSKTGITTMAVQSGGAYGSGDFLPTLVSGQLVDMTGVLGYGLTSTPNTFANGALNRLLYYYSDGTVPLNGYGVVEIEYFPPGGTTGISPFPDDASFGLQHDGSRYSKIGRLSMTGDLLRSRQTPSEAVLVSGVDATAGELIGVTLTAARLVGAPLNPVTGQRLTFTLIQGGAGAFAVTWNAVFKKTWSDVGNATNARSTISYVYDGTNWNQDSAQAPYV